VTEYLHEIGKTGRRLAICGLGLTAAVSAAINIAVIVVPMDPRARAEIPGTLLATGLVFGCITFASVWMLLRLLRKGRASNKVTMMPVWFIQVFGLLFAAAIGFAAIEGGHKPYLVEAFLVALNMLFLPRLLRRKLSEEVLN
jgi:hypothetical protein